MKKILMVLGVLFLVVLVACAGLMFWAQSSGSKLQEKFFSAVTSGDPAQVTALFHPALREEVDEPVLAAWMEEIRSKLGVYRGLSKADFNTLTKFEGGVRITESQGTVHFEKGSAHSELVFHDGQLVKFKVKSDSIPDDWFEGPASTALYRQRGEEFLKHLLKGDADATFHAMHPSLQKSLSREKLETMISNIRKNAGEMKSVTFQSEEPDKSDGYILKLFYNVACDKAETTALVEFRFIGMKGHILAFDLTGEKAAARRPVAPTGQ